MTRKKKQHIWRGGGEAQRGREGGRIMVWWSTFSSSRRNIGTNTLAKSPAYGPPRTFFVIESIKYRHGKPGCSLPPAQTSH